MSYADAMREAMETDQLQGGNEPEMDDTDGHIDVLICLDDAHDPGLEQEPCFDGPKDEPVWALYLVTVGERDPEWRKQHVASGVTYTEARNLAKSLGYTSIPIGASPDAGQVPGS